jgi:hypothetical protein
MALIAEYETSSAFAHDALRAVPSTTLEHETITYTAEGALRWAFWATGGALGEFEAALSDDDTVEAFETLTDVDGRRLYQATVVDHGSNRVYSLMTDRGIQLLDVTHSIGRTINRVRCPSREAFLELKRVWTEEYERFETRRLFTEATRGTEATALTPKQREALCRASENGYFRVPRETTLGTLGGTLGVSTTAASQRIRRGIDTLLTDVCEE